jgi:hypothetical protein
MTFTDTNTNTNISKSTTNNKNISGADRSAESDVPLPDARHEARHVDNGDVRVCSISLCAGVGGIDHWIWACDIYPASHRGVRAHRTAHIGSGCPN